MSVNPRLTGLALALAALAAPALAQNVKKFFDEVRPIALPDEEKQWKSIKDNRDREEFARIFWARRDPDLEAPGNEARTAYEAARADANKRFVGTGRAGADTDCGRVFILLGAPDEAVTGDGTAGGRKLETAKLVREMQTWTYRDREGLKFKDGQVKITFDESCSLPQGARLGDQLARVAEGKITQPNIDYKKGPDGHIVKLEEQLPKPTPVMELLNAPRQDFPSSAETKLLLRTPDGATYVAGLLRTDAAAFPVGAAASVGAKAIAADGKVAGTYQRESSVNAEPGGNVVSYGMSLRPGDYTLRVGVFDPKTKKGSALEQPLTVPDFSAQELSLSPVFVLQEVQDNAPADNKAALYAFQLGNTRLVPRYANVFQTSDSITLLGFIYGGKVADDSGITMEQYLRLEEGMTYAQAEQTLGRPGQESARSGSIVSYTWSNSDGSNVALTFQNDRLTSKAQAGLPQGPKRSVTATFKILQNGRELAVAPPQKYELTPTGPSVGPVPLAKYKPGTYMVQMTVKDDVANKEYKSEATFEVK